MLLLYSLIEAQQDTSISINEYLEYFSEESTIEDEDSQLPELIEQLMSNPININLASASELLVIPILDFSDAQKIVEHRNRNGYFFSKRELYSVESLESELVKLLIPLISVDRPQLAHVPERTTLLPIYLQVRSRAQYDLQTRRGFESGIYRGNRIKSYQRLRMRYGNNYSFGILAEKDAGEKDYNDFTTYFLKIDNFLNSKIIVGDYTAQFGQGLVLWSPYGFSKGSEAVATISRNARTFYANGSSDENRYFRGAAISTNFSGIGIDAFYSSNKIDANLDAQLNRVTSLDISGYHRTGNEINKRDELAITTAGFKLSFSPMINSQISIIHLKTDLDKKLTSNNPFSVEGKSFQFSSVSYQFIFDRIYFTGETASNYSAVATINNLTLKITRQFSAVVSVRNYPRNYTTLYANGMGESSNTINEFGIYTGFKWNTGFGRFNIYYDQFKFPAPGFRNPRPANGNEYMMNYDYNIAKGTKLFFKIFSETKETVEEDDGVLSIFEKNIKKYRVSFIMNPSRNLRLKSLVEYISFRIKEINYNENGYLIYQDVRYDAADFIRIYGRIELFNTDSYNTRLYAFENDLTGVLSNLPLYGKGLRWYFLVTVQLINSLRLSCKYSEMYKSDVKSIGSGFNEIEGNLDNRISLQLDFSM